ncbi:MAG: glycogen debranching protein GlgX [Pasteurellaceae bacterium]|nr:glycogen debranching protein GlgX [Pasteurellaceae bacterium]
MKTAIGQATPLGYSYLSVNGELGLNFVLFSNQAERVELCLFDQNGTEQRVAMYKTIQRNAQNQEECYWHCWVEWLPFGTQYAYRLSDSKGRCNPAKLMLDPYAKAVVGKPNLSSDEQCAWFLLSDPRDNAHLAPKALIINQDFDWQDEQKPHTPWQHTIIYELHIKGFSQLRQDLPQSIRGSYTALAQPESLHYLQELGITAVEILPINYFISEPHLQQKGLTNYWGYNPLAMFAPESRYAVTDNPLLEVKQMVKALHQAGIEVILDVVFNHSAESEQDFPTFSFRGIDDRTYYWHNAQDEYLNWTGCGNLLNLSHNVTRRWLIDCLVYWARDYHINGFRFDLGTVLGREPYFNPCAQLFADIANEPVLQDCKFIVEPWDIGEYGYQLGNFPADFAEWNDRFRDDVTRFWLWKSGELGAFAQRFSGSSDLLQQNGQPHKSINFITAHDGFTLRDLVSYNHKHNEANGEQNRDGRNQNYSYNHGIEGQITQIDNDSLKTEVKNSRIFSTQALLASLLLAHGTPMLLAGDEFGHTQQGNNNAYCQDNPISWLNWDGFEEDLFQYAKQIIALRKQIYCLNNDKWWTDKQVDWLNCDGLAMTIPDWHNPHSKAFQVLLDGRWLCLINAKAERQHFVLPQGKWQRLDNHQTLQNQVVMEDLAFKVLQQIR